MVKLTTPNQEIQNPPSNDNEPRSLPENLRKLAEPPRQVAGIVGDMQEYLHNTDLINQITTANNSSATLKIINDYTSNGSEAGRPKQVSTLSPGAKTPGSADTDVILPVNSETRFVLPGGYITNPGSAIRTSGWGNVEIRDVPTAANTFIIHFKGGVTPGSVSEIPNPIVDSSSPFNHTRGIEELRQNFR